MVGVVVCKSIAARLGAAAPSLARCCSTFVVWPEEPKVVKHAAGGRRADRSKSIVNPILSGAAALRC